MNIQTNKWIFQDDVTTTGDGNVFRTGRNDLVTVFITGTSSSRTIVFEGCDGEDTPNWYSLSAIKLPDRTIAESTTGTDEVWEIPLANFVAVRCRVSAVAGGAVRVTGRVVEVGTGMVGSKEVSLLASTNIAGKFGIDQTTDGTTNGVVVNSSALPTGASTEAKQDTLISLFTSNASGIEMLTIDNTVGGISLTPANYTTCTKALIQVQDAPIRYWNTGDAPTITSGILAQTGATIYLDTADDIANFKAIRLTSVSANLACQYSN